MMRATNTRRRFSVIAIAFAAVALAGCAGTSPTGEATGSPTPTAPVQAVDVATGETDEDIAVAVAAGTDGVSVTFREITIAPGAGTGRSEEHTSELQSLMRISYAVFCLKKKTCTSKSTSHN